MSRVKDLTGKQFGRLMAIGMYHERASKGGVIWSCLCECGVGINVRSSSLVCGYTRSCGCLLLENRGKLGKNNIKAAQAACITHGLSDRTGNFHYTRWQNIKQRTGNPNAPNYHNYGGRGISFYPAWRDSFVAFKAWLDENLGPCPKGYTLDRIDNDGNYEPGNLRWASRKQQRINQRTTK